MILIMFKRFLEAFFLVIFFNILSDVEVLAVPVYSPIIVFMINFLLPVDQMIYAILRDLLFMPDGKRLIHRCMLEGWLTLPLICRSQNIRLRISGLEA